MDKYNILNHGKNNYTHKKMKKITNKLQKVKKSKNRKIKKGISLLNFFTIGNFPKAENRKEEK